jgi:hypothetical protein
MSPATRPAGALADDDEHDERRDAGGDVDQDPRHGDADPRQHDLEGRDLDQADHRQELAGQGRDRDPAIVVAG